MRRGQQPPNTNPEQPAASLAGANSTNPIVLDDTYSEDSSSSGSKASDLFSFQDWIQYQEPELDETIKFGICSASKYRVTLRRNYIARQGTFYYNKPDFSNAEPEEDIQLQGGHLGAFKVIPSANIEDAFSNVIGAFSIPAWRVRTAPRSKKRSAMQTARAEIKNLVEKAEAFRQEGGRECYDHVAFMEAFRARLFVTVARTMWTFVSDHIRWTSVRSFERRADREHYSGEAVNSLQADIPQLQQDGGIVDLEPTAADMDETEIKNHPEIRQLWYNTGKLLHHMLIDGLVVDYFEENHIVLEGVHRLLQSRIRWDRQVEILSKAMVVFTVEQFFSDSAVVSQYIEANDQRLQQMDG